MGVPLRQKLAVGSYLLKKKLAGQDKYPLVLMLEPLFRCNLACAGCGKIDYPDEILNQRMSVEDCLSAVDECGAPVVSIAGGEPLVHKEIDKIAAGIIAKKKFVYLCTNAVLMKRRLKDFKPSPYFTWSVHLDGVKERHDSSVCKDGVFDVAVAAIREAREAGFRVNINCTLFQGETSEDIAEFLDLVPTLGVEGVTISPGFSYERAPRQDVFLGRSKTKQIFRDLFKIQKTKKEKWPLNHSSLYLDFLAGNQNYKCTPWGNPTRNLFGWQRPCYLLVAEGYAKTFKELMEETDWDNYGTGNNPKCDNCMAHCGYEATAVQDMINNPIKGFLSGLRGPRTEGPFAPEPKITYTVEEEEPELETAKRAG